MTLKEKLDAFDKQTVHDARDAVWLRKAVEAYKILAIHEDHLADRQADKIMGRLNEPKSD